MQIEKECIECVHVCVRARRNGQTRETHQVFNIIYLRVMVPIFEFSACFTMNMCLYL